MERGIPMKKKGFTLVELIVVLVILAILAALLIPALTGYIDKANEEKLQATTRQVVVAAQSVVSEAYAQSAKFEEGRLTAVNSTSNATFENDAINHINMGEICELAELAKDVTKVTTDEGAVTYQGKLNNKDILWVNVHYDENGKVLSAQVATASKICTYDGDAGTYTVSALS